jgi:hypothetical protein
MIAHVRATIALALVLMSPAPGQAADQPATPTIQSIQGLDMPLPAGWKQENDPAGAIVLHPAGPQHDPKSPAQFMMIVLPTRPLRGTFWETHRAVFDEVVKGSQLTNTVETVFEPDAPGPFIRSATAGDDANKSVKAIRLYSALSEGGIECVVVYGNEEFIVTGPMLHRTAVRKPAKPAGRTKIVEAYRRLSAQLQADAHRGEYLLGSVPYERIWLRADGVADFTPLYPEGSAASRVPSKVDARLQNGRFGSWKAGGEKEVHIVRRPGQPAEVYLRENGNLRLGDKVYEPMPSVDGLKLNGRWSLPGDKARRIEFTAAGRFKDEGLLEDVGYLPVHAWTGAREVSLPRPPARGEGTYEVREFTLLLKYDDGRAWSADLSIEGADPKDVSKILLKTGVLHLEP